MHSVSNDTEFEALAVTGCAALIRVLMNYLKRWVFRWHLKVPIVGGKS